MVLGAIIKNIQMDDNFEQEKNRPSYGWLGKFSEIQASDLAKNEARPESLTYHFHIMLNSIRYTVFSSKI